MDNHITGGLLSFLGFACLLYAGTCFLKNTKDNKNIKAVLYSGITGVIFIIAGISLVLHSAEEETGFIRYGSLKKMEHFYFLLQHSCAAFYFT